MEPFGEIERADRGSPLLQCFHMRRRTPDGRVLFEDATVEIHRRDFVCLVGPSGSGKTAFFRLLLCLDSLDGGQILFQGRNIHRMPSGELPLLRRAIGIVLQDLRLLPDRSVFENAALPLEAAGRDRLFIQERAWRVLRLTGLERRMYEPVNHLTTAEKKRLAFARAVANEPCLLLADEPAGGADEEASRAILELLRRIHLQGVAVILATNEPALPASFPGSRTVSIEHGKFVEGSMTLRGRQRISSRAAG